MIRDNAGIAEFEVKFRHRRHPTTCTALTWAQRIRAPYRQANWRRSRKSMGRSITPSWIEQ
jgi:hypothetical protein